MPARLAGMAEPAPTRDDLANELALLLAEGARAILKEREAERQAEPAPAKTPANSRTEGR